MANSSVTPRQSDSGRKEKVKSKAATKNCTHFFAQRVRSVYRKTCNGRVEGLWPLTVLGDRRGDILSVRIAPFHCIACCAANYFRTAWT